MTLPKPPVQAPGQPGVYSPEAILARYRAEDPCYRYQPGPTQARFHQSPAYYRLVTGGGRSGKTTSCLVDLSMCLRGIHPYRKPLSHPMIALVFCISRQQAAMVSQRKLFEACEFPDPPLGPGPVGIGSKPLIPKREIKELGTLKVGFRTIYDATLHNGSKVYFSWSDAEDTWKRIQGVKVDYIYLDENAGNDKLLIECYKRVLDSQNSNDWSGCITWGATGTEINNAFETYRARCLDPTDKDHEIFRITPGENKTIAPAALERFASTLTDEQKKIHITGEDTAAGLVQIYAKQWADVRHMRVKDYTPTENDNLWLSYDPGVDHPTGMLISAITQDEPITLNCVKFWNHRAQTLDYDIAELENFLLGRRLAGVIYDSLAAAKDKRGRSLIQDMQELMQTKGMMPMVGFYRAEKPHWAGISLMRHMLDPDPHNKSVAPLIRLNMSAQSGCQLLRYQLCKYQGKESTKFTGEGGVVKKEDEGPDCLRYQAMKRAAWNSAWRCGNSTMEAREGALPVKLDIPAPETPESNLDEYQKQLRRSRVRAKGRNRYFRVCDF